MNSSIIIPWFANAKARSTGKGSPFAKSSAAVTCSKVSSSGKVLLHKKAPV
jgi:hypothetical protein